MGRVYEALKRAAERSDSNGNGNNGNGHGGTTAATEASNVHDAMHRAAEVADGGGDVTTEHAAAPPAARDKVIVPNVAAAANTRDESFEHVLRNSTVFNNSPASHDAHGRAAFPAARKGSASNEHTEFFAGSALPGDPHSRAAGATLDAVSSARAVTFPTLEIVPSRVEPHLVTITNPRTPFAERFRSLRTRVLHAGERKGVQTIVITSSGIMEGKTVTSINLAWQLAQADGVSCLLIDSDLRHPCAAEYLALDAPTGLSEVLAGEATLEESIVRLEPAGLHLLPGGTARDDVADLLSGPRFAAVIAEARKMFNYIIIDAPPLGIFTDAAVLMNRADAALLVVRAGRVRYTQLERLLEGLPQERILGVVLNGSDEQLDESNYYYYQRREGGGKKGARSASSRYNTKREARREKSRSDESEDA